MGYRALGLKQDEALEFSPNSQYKTRGLGNIKSMVSRLRRAVFGSRDRQWIPHMCRDLSCDDKFKSVNVPQGFVAVYAGRERKRFVIPTIYLNHPAFRLLLEKAKEEFGFSQKGGLNMPFEVLLFERFLWLVGHGDPAPNGLGVEELERYYWEKYHLATEIIHLDD